MILRWAAILFVFVPCLIFGQNEENQAAKIARVKVGMSELQVKKIVGNPEIVEKFKTIKRNTIDTCTYWRYENDITIIFKKHLVIEVERDHNALLQRIQDWADRKNKDSILLLYK